MPDSFAACYIAGDARAHGFLRPRFGERDERIRIARARSARAAAPAVIAALTDGEPSAARRANREALARPGTAVVVTGQQVGLFLGPLYTYYKAASSVAVARALERESGIRCVPIFW